MGMSVCLGFLKGLCLFGLRQSSSSYMEIEENNEVKGGATDVEKDI